jgi:hypothetical protein
MYLTSDMNCHYNIFFVIVAKEAIQQFENYSNNQATEPQDFNPLYYQI